MTFGELVELIGPLIPRYEVERHWHTTHPKSNGIVATNQKIHACLARELQRYPLHVFGVERAQGRAWTADMKIKAIVRECALCGTAYVAQKKVRTCSAKCAAHLGHSNRPVNREGDQSMPTVVPPPLGKPHPELAALEAVYQALRPLDRDARKRVMTYATHLIEDEDQPAGLRVIEQHRDSAD